MENNTVIYGSIQATSNGSGRLIKSFDSGATWEAKNVPDPAIQAVGFINRDRGWMGGHGSGFLETNDGGDTWTDLGLGWSLNRFVFINENLAYCSGVDIYKFDDNLSVGDSGQREIQDLEIVIAPMPIKDKLEIEIDFLHIDNLVITLYDINGKLIDVLKKDKVSDSGKKKYSFEFNYPPAVYLLDFHTNNGKRTKTIVKE